MYDNDSRNKTGLIIVGILLAILVMIIPIAPNLFPKDNTLGFAHLSLNDSIESLNDNSLTTIFEDYPTLESKRIQLDTDLSILGNRSLRDVFETGNPITNGDFSTSTISNFDSYGSLKRVTTNTLELYNFTDVFPSFRSIANVGLKDDYVYIFGKTKGNSLTTQIQFKYRDVNASINIIYSTITTNLTSWNSFSGIVQLPSNSLAGGVQFAYSHSSIPSESIFCDDMGVVNLSSLSLTSLTKQTLDTLFSYYQKLKNAESFTNEVNGSYYTNSTYLFDLDSMKTDQLYSPLFSTTFDLMSDTDLKTQLDSMISTDGLNSILYDFAITTEQIAFYKSLYDELYDLDGGLPNQIYDDFYTNDSTIIDVTPLKANYQYSPIYQKTFDAMTDSEILVQMNQWYFDKLL